jgi:ABC-type transporter Mla MlaB component
MANDEHECWRYGTSYDGAVDLDVSWLESADLDAVDALARLHVVALRCGRSIRLHHVHRGLAELLELLGLDDVLHLCPRCQPAPKPTSPAGGGPA